MARLHLVAAEIDGGGLCRFRFQIEQAEGLHASLDLDVPFATTASGGPDIRKIFSTARAELVATLLDALIGANRLDDGLVPRQEQATPNASTMLDLSAPANDDGWYGPRRADGTS